MSLAMKNRPFYIAPSILSADFSDLGREIARVEQAGADWLHVDVMDGHFVPNITIGPPVVASVRQVTRLPLDVHLMIEEPSRYVASFAKAGADRMSIHIEIKEPVRDVLDQIRALGASPGIVLNPDTPLEAILPLLNAVDLVLVMSVNPGFGGQSFIPHVLEKIRRLKTLKEEREGKWLIEVDGGIGLHNIADVRAAGAEVFVAGSAIFGSGDYEQTIGEMREKVNKLS